MRFFRLTLARTLAHWAVGLRHNVTEAIAVPLIGAAWWRIEAFHERPEESAEGLGCVDVRILGCSVDVFYSASGAPARA